jgi:acetylornithine deacetylase
MMQVRSPVPEASEILARLVAFPTVSRQSNLALLAYVEELLRPAGVRLERYASEDGTRANLWASIGPDIAGGIVLSGHCDVVPVAGQNWSSDPFAMRAKNGNLYGRGTADMKGFLAVAIQAVLLAAGQTLRLPLHLAVSYDEEIGCLGVRGMLDMRRTHPARPALCLIGEPTGMRVAVGHKGKRALRACCVGHEGHSALAPNALNALHLGVEFVTALRARQARLEAEGARDSAYDIPYSTLHVGTMQGGTALNIVPGRCDLEFELRNVAADDPDAIIAGIRTDADAITAGYRDRFPRACVMIEDVSGYPGLDNPANAPAVLLLQSLLHRQDPPVKVAFGTEGGLFQEALGIPTLICGPGHMEQGHRPDEFVSEAQLAECASLMLGIVGVLVDGRELAPSIGTG